MSEWTHKEGKEGIKKQVQKLIDQACDNAKNDGITEGRNEAWEAVKYCVNADEAREYNYAFDGCIAKEIFKNYTASEAINKLRKYEEQKEQKEESIEVGDEVLFNGCAKAVVLRTRMRGLENYCFIICADGSGGECEKLKLKKTGRTFPQIAEVLKKMKEGE